LLQSVAGVRADHVAHPWGNTYYPVVRACGVPAVYVDGARIAIDPANGVGINDFLSSNIELIEIYKGSSTAPTRYPSRGGCGTILIWTHTPG
ncbi:MAG: Plug domain-containing protein, partial [Gemmatimonadota bacterium]